MKRGNRFLIAAIAAISVLAVVAAASIAGSNTTPAPTVAAPVPQAIDQSIKDAVHTFDSPSRSQATVNDRAKFAAGINERAKGDAYANVDFGNAVPISIPGSPAAPAWVAPSGKKICLFAPAFPDSYGSTCVTVEDINAGRGLLITTPGNDEPSQLVNVVSVVANGGSLPKLTDGKGLGRAMQVSDNIAVASVLRSGTLSTAAGTIHLDTMKADEK